MSQTIDRRVVEMEFDNSNFEKNTKTTMSTIEKLKNALSFKGIEKGFETIESAARKTDLSPISKAVETVQAKFSTMDVVFISALNRITSAAVDAGMNLVKSLSTDNIAAGWEKYTEKTQSVQTIMSATAKDFTDVGVQMEYVNDQLEKLNWYTDETSAGYMDMVNNIGKFTSNGVKLDVAVTAMQGIANWGYRSGAGLNEMSRAMYNLSQALATGSVKLIDWKSIENANMATSEFKETVIQTAVEMGTLKKAGDDLYKTLDGKDTVSVTNFNNALSKGWFTSDVLLKSLNRYGEFSNVLYKVSSRTGKTATELLDAIEEYRDGTLNLESYSKDTGISVSELGGYFRELTDDTMNLGEKAFRAAQEAKTLQEAINAVKDAVSTGWMKTFEIVFGDYLGAKKLWTELSGILYDMFAGGIKDRNDMLEKAMGDRKGLIESEKAWTMIAARAKHAGVSIEDFKKTILDVARASGIAVDDILDQFGSFEEAVYNGGWLTTDIAGKALKLLAGDLKIVDGELKDNGSILKKTTDLVDQIIAGAYGNGEERVKRLTEAGYDYNTVQNLVNKTVWKQKIAWSSLSDEQLKNLKYTDEEIQALKDYNGSLKIAGSSVEEMKDLIDRVIKGEFGVGDDRVKRLTEAGYDYYLVQDLVNKTVWNQTIAWEELSDAQLESLGYTKEQIAEMRRLADDLENQESGISGLLAAYEKMGGRELLIDTFRNALNGLMEIIELVKDAWNDIFPPMTAQRFYNMIDRVHELSKYFRFLYTDTTEVTDGLTDTEKGMHKLTPTGEKLKSILKGVFSIFDLIKTVIGQLISSGFNLVTEIFKAFGSDVLGAFGSAGDALTTFVDKVKKGNFIGGVFKGITDIIVRAINAVKGWFDSFKQMELVQKGLDWIKRTWETVSSAVSGFFERNGGVVNTFAKGLGYVYGIIVNIFKAIKNIPFVQKSLDFIKNALDALFDPNKKLELKFGDNFSHVLDAIKTAWERFITPIKWEFEQFWATITGGAKDLTGRPDMIVDAAASTIGQNGSMVGGVVKRFFGTTIDFVKNVFTHVKDFFINTRDKITGLFSKSTIGEKILEFWEKIKSSLIVVRDGIKDFFGTNALGKLAALVIAGTSLFVTLKAGGMFSAITEFLEGWGGLGKSIKGVMNSVSARLIITSLRSIVGSLAIVIGMVIALTFIPDKTRLWESFGLVAAIAGVLSLLFATFAGMAAKASKVDVKAGPAIALLIASYTAALFAIFYIIKELSTIKKDEGNVWNGIFGLAAAIGALIALVVVVNKNSKVMGKKSENSAKIVAALAGSLLLTSKAILVLSDVDPGPLFKALIAYMVMMGFLTMLVKAMKGTAAEVKGAKEIKDVFIGGGAVLAIAVGILLLVIAIKQISKAVDNDPVGFAKGILGLVGIFLAFSVVLVALRKTASQMKGVGGAILGISVGMMALVLALKLMQTVEWEKIGLEKAAIFGGLLILLGIISALGYFTEKAKYAMRAGIMILMISGAMTLLVGAIALITLIPEQDKVKDAAKIITGFLAIFGLVLWAAQDVKGAAGVIIAIDIAIAMLAGVLWAVTEFIPEDKLLTSAGVIGALLAIFAVIVGVSHNVEKATGVIIAMDTAIILIGGVLWAMSALGVTDALDNAKALAIVLLAISASLFIISMVSKQLGGIEGMGKQIGFVAAIGGILSALSVGVFGLLKLLNIDPAIDDAAALAVFIVALAGAVALISFSSGVFAVAGWKGWGMAMLTIVGIIVILGGTMLILHAVLKHMDDSELDRFTNQEIPAIIRIFEAMGEMAAGLILGVAKQLLNILPVFGSVLSQFVENLDGFINNITRLTQEHLDSTLRLAAIIGVLGGETLLASFTGLFNIIGSLTTAGSLWTLVNWVLPSVEKMATLSKDDYDKALIFAQIVKTLDEANLASIAGLSLGVLKDDLTDLAKGIMNFAVALRGGENDSNALTSIDMGRASVATSIISMLGGISTYIKEVKGISSSTFADDMQTLASGTTRFVGLVRSYNLTSDDIDMTKNVVSIFEELYREFPMNQNSIAAKSAAMQSVSSDLSSVATGIVGFLYSLRLLHLKDTDIDNTKLVVDTFIELYRKMPNNENQFTLMSMLFGTKNWAKFGEEIAALGVGIQGFAKSITVGTKLNSDLIEDSKTIVGTFVELYKELPDTKLSILSMTISGKSFKSFGKQLPILGAGIKGFQESLQGVNLDPSLAEQGKTVAQTVASFQEFMPKEASWIERVFGKENAISFETFGAGMSKLGEGIAGYVSGLGDIDQSGIAKANRVTDSLANFFSKLGAVGGLFDWFMGHPELLSQYGEQMRTMGLRIHDYASFVRNVATDTFNLATDNLDRLLKVLLGVDELNPANVSMFGSSLTALAESGVQGFSDIWSTAYDSVEGAVAELSDRLTTTAQIYSAIVAVAFKSLMDKSLLEMVNIIRAYYSKSIFPYGFYEAGIYIVDGLSNGIADRQWKATDAASTVGRKVLQQLNKTLGIESPSKLAKESGSFFTEGFSIGIVQTMSEAIDSSKHLGKSAIDALGDVISNVAEVVDGDLDFTPTITPVLDLTEIQNGTTRANSMMSRMNNYSVRANADVQGSLGRATLVQQKDDQLAQTVEGLTKTVQALTENQERPSITNTFNITGDDPKEIAAQVSKIIQRQVERSAYSWA